MSETLTIEQKRALAMAKARARAAAANAEEPQRRGVTDPGGALGALGAVNKGFETLIPMSDEIVSGFRAGTTGLVRGIGQGFKESAIPGVPNVGAIARTIGDTYIQSQEEERALRAGYREQNPLAYRAGQAAGIVGGTGAGVGRAKQLVQRAPGLATIGRASAEGAVVGGLYGFGDAEGGIAERAEGAAQGALLGGATAGTLSAAGVGAQKLGLTKRASNAWLRITQGEGSPTRTARAKREAVLKLQQAFERDGISPEDAARRLDEWAKLGAKPETLADLGGENVRGLAEALAAVPGTGRSKAVELYKDRQFLQGQRLIDDLSKAGGVNPAQYLDDIDAISTRQVSKSRPLYEAFEAEQGIPAKELQDFLRRPSFKAALDNAIATAKDKGQFYADGILERLAAEDVTKEMTIPPKYLDQIKQQLDAMVGSARRSNAEDAGLKFSRYRALRDDWRAFLDQRYPNTYKAARDAWAGEEAVKDAITEGGEAFRKKVLPDEMRRTLKRMGEAEQEAFRRGFVREVYRKFTTESRGINRARQIDTEALEQSFKELFGPNADTLLANIRREANMVETMNTVIGNSATARRMASIQDSGLAPDMADAVGNIVTGRPLSAAGDLVRGGARRLEAAAMLPETKEELAKLLFDPATPAKVKQLARRKLILISQNPTIGRQAGAVAGSSPEQ